MNLEELQARFEKICWCYGIGDVAMQELWDLILESRGEL